MAAPEVQAWACGDAAGLSIDDATPEDMFRWAYAAAGSGVLKLLRLLLERGVDLHMLQSGYERSLLVAAAESGQLDCVASLLSHAGERAVELINHQEPTRGTFALQTAAAAGHVEVVKALLDHGPGVDVSLTRSHGNGALSDAASAGYLAVITLLLQHSADVNHANNNGKTALAYAAQSCDIDAMSLLIANGATVDITEAGTSGLHQWVDKSTKTPSAKAAARLWIESKRDESSSFSALKFFYSAEATIDQEVHDAISSALAKWRNSRDAVAAAEVIAVVERMQHLPPYSDARRVAMNTFVRTIGEPAALADWLDIITAEPDATAISQTLPNGSVKRLYLSDYARHSHYGHFQFVLLRSSLDRSTLSSQHASRAADSQAAFPDWFDSGWAVELSIWQPSFVKPSAVFLSDGTLKPDTLREPPHTHPHEFFSKVVTGSMRHSRYIIESEDTLTPGHGSTSEQTVAKNGAYADVEFNKVHEVWPPHNVDGKCRLKAVEENVEFSAGESYRMPLGVIHDVEFDAVAGRSGPAITCVLCAEQEVAPDVFMENSMLSYHNSHADLADHDHATSVETWRENLRVIAAYLRQETDTLILDPGTDEVKDTFLMMNT
jgi:hypothetical protein